MNSAHIKERLVKLKRILLVRNAETATDSGFDLLLIPVDHFPGER